MNFNSKYAEFEVPSVNLCGIAEYAVLNFNLMKCATGRQRQEDTERG